MKLYIFGLAALILAFVLLFFAVGCESFKELAPAEKTTNTNNQALINKSDSSSIDNSFSLNLPSVMFPDFATNSDYIKMVLESKRALEIEREKIIKSKELYKSLIYVLGIVAVIFLFLKSPLQWFKSARKE